MIVCKNHKWDKSQTDLSKYFIEKILQLTDYEELITNRHKTTNGYILLSEINDVSRLVINRQKSVYRFSSLLRECTDIKLSTSLVNDPIIKKYHTDIIKYYKSLDIPMIEKNQAEIKKLQTKTRVYLKKLDLEYYDNLKTEFFAIDLKSKNFRIVQQKIDLLCETLVPHLIYLGYSTESISNIAIILASKDIKLIFKFFFSVFNLENKVVTYLLSTAEDKETNESLTKYLEDNSIRFTNHKSTKFTFEDPENISEDVILFEIETLDPNSFIRHTYDFFIKDFIISKDRTSLNYFTNFFDKTCWKIKGDKKNFFRKSGFNHDPINVTTRNSTLRDTLIKVSDYYGLDFKHDSLLYKIDCIAESQYYYNLALGSKSIENSLNLLWTALEALIPYGKHQSDITNIQYFFPKFLSCGSIGRQLMSFIIRFQTTNGQNGYSLNAIKSNIDYRLDYDLENIVKWLNFVITDFEKEDDPYDQLKTCSELLCVQFCNLNESWGRVPDDDIIKYGKVKSWLNRINSSKLSIEYQLDRIYLHRNQIVHTAKFINEYSNLWTHLEWYVGKILSYFFIKSKQYNDNQLNKKEILIELEGECEMIYQLLDRNSDKNIIELSGEEKNKIFKQVWQFM